MTTACMMQHFFWFPARVPTVNARWERQDRAAFVRYVRGKYGPCTSPYFQGAVHLLINVSTRHQRYDADNVIKPMIDAITEAGSVWRDDSQVVEVIVRKTGTSARPNIALWISEAP